MKKVSLLLLVVLIVLATLPGCSSWGRASYEAWSWGGETFAPNPVALAPYWIGFGLFAIVGLPLDLVSWPLTALFFPREKEEPARELYLFSALGPSVFLGTGGGTLLGGIFYPFGMPFMSPKSDWNEKPAPRDDEPLPPPPGGDRPPVKNGEKPR